MGSACPPGPQPLIQMMFVDKGMNNVIIHSTQLPCGPLSSPGDINTSKTRFFCFPKMFSIYFKNKIHPAQEASNCVLHTFPHKREETASRLFSEPLASPCTSVVLLAEHCHEATGKTQQRLLTEPAGQRRVRVVCCDHRFRRSFLRSWRNPGINSCEFNRTHAGDNAEMCP